MEGHASKHSPARRKHSLVQKFESINETLGDIESEIHSRRLKAINKSTETQRRSSAAPLLAGYSASQLSQHCKDVIKLSIENKINSKNAFNFWLIDVMAAMAKRTDSEINKNFQVASCTLDASVKIYGYRVDAIHTDAVKIAGGFLRKDVADDKEKTHGETNENEPATTKGMTKKKRKKLTVVPPESLNAKTEAEVLLDVKPKPSFLTRKPDGNDLLLKIPICDDGGLLMLDSDHPYWPHNGKSTSVTSLKNNETTVDREILLPLISSIQLCEGVCSVYDNFQFGTFRPDEKSDEDSDLQTSQNSGRFEFDANASIHDVSLEHEPQDQRNRIKIPAGGIESDEEIVVLPEQQMKSFNFTITDMKSRISINPSEYSMFDEKMFKAWAGPAYWKVKPVRKPLGEFANGENLSKPVASKRTRKGNIKSHAGLFEILEDVLKKKLAETEKTTLFKSTMLSWTLQNMTMPKDLKCQSKNLFTLYHIPFFSVIFKEKSGETAGSMSYYKEEEGEAAASETEEETKEIDYCSASVLQEDDEFRPAEEKFNLVGGDEVWDSKNMVEAPHKIQRMHVSTFKRRKHVDMRRLKSHLWIVLKDAAAEKKSKMEEALEFEELYRMFLSKMSKNSGIFLSAPLIFNALLHLTNDKSLTLTRNKSKKFDFSIHE